MILSNLTKTGCEIVGCVWLLLQICSQQTYIFRCGNYQYSPSADKLKIADRQTQYRGERNSIQMEHCECCSPRLVGDCYTMLKMWTITQLYSANGLTPRSTVLLESCLFLSQSKKFTAICVTQKSITAFTTAHNLFLSSDRSILSTTHYLPIPWRSILILFSHLLLGLTSGIFPSGFPTKILYAPLLSPISVTCLAIALYRYNNDKNNTNIKRKEQWERKNREINKLNEGKKERQIKVYEAYL